MQKILLRRMQSEEDTRSTPLKVQRCKISQLHRWHYSCSWSEVTAEVRCSISDPAYGSLCHVFPFLPALLCTTYETQTDLHGWGGWRLWAQIRYVAGPPWLIVPTPLGATVHGAAPSILHQVSRGNRRFPYATHVQPWHSFTSACTLHPHFFIIAPPPLSPSPRYLPLLNFFFFFPSKSKFPFCRQKCWVLLFALYTEIRWGCKLSLNICSLEWSRRGEARSGAHVCSGAAPPSECVMRGFVYVCVHARVSEQLFK